MRILTILVYVLILHSIKAAAKNLYKAQYLGCYKDYGWRRSLTGDRKDFGGRNTVERCTDWCFEKGYRLAGLQYAYECWCGNSYRDEQYRKDADGCTDKCSGNDKQSCGGGNRNDLYRLVPVTTTISTTTTTTTTTPTTTTTTATTTTTTPTITTPTTTTTTPTTTMLSTTTTIPTATSTLSEVSSQKNQLSTSNQSDSGLSTSNQSDSGSQTGDKTSPGIGVYIGVGVATFVVTTIIVIAVVVSRRRKRSQPTAVETDKKNLYTNPSYLPNSFDDGESGRGSATPNNGVTLAQTMPMYENTTFRNNAATAASAASAASVADNTYDTADDNAENGEHGTAIYCNTADPIESYLNTIDASELSTAPTTEQNSPPDVYATVNKTPAAAHEGSNTDPLYSLAEPIEDDMVVIENDLYGT